MDFERKKQLKGLMTLCLHIYIHIQVLQFAPTVCPLGFLREISCSLENLDTTKENDLIIWSKYTEATQNEEDQQECYVIGKAGLQCKNCM